MRLKTFVVTTCWPIITIWDTSSWGTVTVTAAFRFSLGKRERHACVCVCVCQAGSSPGQCHGVIWSSLQNNTQQSNQKSSFFFHNNNSVCVCVWLWARFPIKPETPFISQGSSFSSHSCPSLFLLPPLSRRLDGPSSGAASFSHRCECIVCRLNRSPVGRAGPHMRTWGGSMTVRMKEIFL